MGVGLVLTLGCSSCRGTCATWLPSSNSSKLHLQSTQRQQEQKQALLLLLLLGLLALLLCC